MSLMHSYSSGGSFVITCYDASSPATSPCAAYPAQPSRYGYGVDDGETASYGADYTYDAARSSECCPIAQTSIAKDSQLPLKAPFPLLYYGLRFYNPGIGRWLSRDPMGERGGVATYCFVDNSPLTSSDAIGLKKDCQVIVVWAHGAVNAPASDLIRRVEAFNADAGVGFAVSGIGCITDGRNIGEGKYPIGNGFPNTGPGYVGDAGEEKDNGGLNDPKPERETHDQMMVRAAKGFVALVDAAWTSAHKKARSICESEKCCPKVTIKWDCASKERDNAVLYDRYNRAGVDNSQVLTTKEDLRIEMPPRPRRQIRGQPPPRVRPPEMVSYGSKRKYPLCETIDTINCQVLRQAAERRSAQGGNP